jgi:hypothetical protein
MPGSSNSRCRSSSDGGSAHSPRGCVHVHSREAAKRGLALVALAPVTECHKFEAVAGRSDKHILWQRDNSTAPGRDIYYLVCVALREMWRPRRVRTAVRGLSMLPQVAAALTSSIAKPSMRPRDASTEALKPEAMAAETDGREAAPDMRLKQLPRSLRSVTPAAVVAATPRHLGRRVACSSPKGNQPCSWT